MNRITFSPEPQPTRYAIVASFDMSGFTKFCSRSDTHLQISRYLARLFQAFDASFEDFWRDLLKLRSGLVQVPRPDHMKFTGDGALALWVREKAADFSSSFCTSLVAALRHFQQQLPKKVAAWETEWRSTDLPSHARFGITTGPVHPLAAEASTTFYDEPVDYAGYHINLAVRLQDHCPDIGFITHAPVDPKLQGLVKLRAVGMKGTFDEPVYVFDQDLHRASKKAPAQIQAKFASQP
jgi:class 3 adenylate cyclase